MPNGNWQKKYSDFESIKSGSPSSYWTYGLERRLKMVRKLVILDDKKILDAGCGIGMFMEKFSEFSSNIYGFDPDPRKIELAKKKFKNVTISGAEKLPYKNNSFDIIWFHEVLEHVDNDRKSVRELVRVLKPGGKLIIFAPNRLWPFETHGIYINGKYKFGNIPLVTWLPNFIFNRLTPHVRNYSNRKIKNLLQALPIKIVHHKHVFPGFDGLQNRSKLLGNFMKGFTKVAESTPLHYFGISHFMILEKL
ncbi:methyltransferase domain-containing protein [Candidatus Dojkabacteria bacterium]|nr:methyltransferase domain-containing protein [Candidatus Dojkabacteria bacterium]